MQAAARGEQCPGHRRCRPGTGGSHCIEQKLCHRLYCKEMLSWRLGQGQREAAPPVHNEAHEGAQQVVLRGIGRPESERHARAVDALLDQGALLLAARNHAAAAGGHKRVNGQVRWLRVSLLLQAFSSSKRTANTAVAHSPACHDRPPPEVGRRVQAAAAAALQSPACCAARPGGWESCAGKKPGATPLAAPPGSPAAGLSTLAHEAGVVAQAAVAAAAIIGRRQRMLWLPSTISQISVTFKIT